LSGRNIGQNLSQITDQFAQQDTFPLDVRIHSSRRKETVALPSSACIEDHEGRAHLLKYKNLISRQNQHASDWFLQNKAR
jgi:hypothetical protein